MLKYLEPSSPSSASATECSPKELKSHLVYWIYTQFNLDDQGNAIPFKLKSLNNQK